MHNQRIFSGRGRTFYSAVSRPTDGSEAILFSETDKATLHNTDNKTKLSHDLIGFYFQIKNLEFMHTKILVLYNFAIVVKKSLNSYDL